jgi:hypothetical protein
VLPSRSSTQRADHATSRIGHETAPNRLSRLLPHRGFHLGAEGLSARNRRFESISLQQRVPANPLIAARESTGRGRFIMWDRVPPRLLFDGPRVRSTSLPSSPEALFACLRRFPRAANWAQRAMRGSQPPLERGDENVERNPILAAARNGQSEGVTARPPTGRLPIRGRREAMIVRSLRRSHQSQRRSSRRPRGGWCRSGAASALHRRSPAR